MPEAVPALPARLVGDGALSAAQLETIIMAADAHARDLPRHFTVAEDWTQASPGDAAGVAFRQGYFLGDGTGAGKGRQVARLILSNWLAGRTRGITDIESHRGTLSTVLRHPRNMAMKPGAAAGRYSH